MHDLNSFIAEAVTEDLSRIEDDNQALRRALLAVLILTEDGGELPEAFREYLILKFRPLLPHWKDHVTPFIEDFKVARGKAKDGRLRLFLPEDFIRSLIPH